MSESQELRRRRAEVDLDALAVSGRLGATARLGTELILAAVSDVSLSAGTVRGWLVDGAEARRVNGSRIGSARDDHELLVLQDTRRGRALEPSGVLVLDGDVDPFGLENGDVAAAELPIDEFAGRYLHGTNGLVQRLIRVPGRRRSLSFETADDLHRLRDAIRPRFPAAVVEAAANVAGHVDALWRIDEKAFYLEGWLLDRTGELAELRALSPEGEEIDLLDRCYRYPRADVSEVFGMNPSERLGFIAYLEVPGGSVLPAGWLLQAIDVHGRGVEIEVPEVLEDRTSLRSTILGDLELERPGDDVLRREHISPAITRLEERLSGDIQIDTVDQHGTPPGSPEMSVIVPLFRQVHFLEQQMAQFVHDPEMASADLIYVLDSPEDAAQLRPFARHLFDLYRIPFRLVTLTGNGGFSVVNNLGASLARGRLLLLLNSDVLPARPGWLSRLAEFYDETPEAGCVAPKLLYEDDSIQHAGLYFDRPPGAEVWSNEHFYKGLHKDFPGANVARAVPAVTGACLLISTELYAELGGLSGGYVRGDYEDSDLCLRLRSHGRQAWYLPDVELYHLEGQSYPSKEREHVSEYNKWLHTQAWRETLTEMEEL